MNEEKRWQVSQSVQNTDNRLTCCSRVKLLPVLKVNSRRVSVTGVSSPLSRRLR